MTETRVTQLTSGAHVFHGYALDIAEELLKEEHTEAPAPKSGKKSRRNRFVDEAGDAPISR